MGTLNQKAAKTLPGELLMRSLVKRVPGAHRMALLTWIGVYPILTLIALSIEPFIASAPTAVRTLMMSLIMVPAMVYFIMPFMKRHFLGD